MSHLIPKPHFQSAARVAAPRCRGAVLALLVTCGGAAIAAPAEYVDRVIDPAAAAQEDDAAGAAAARDASPGLRSWSVEYRLDTRDGNGAAASRGQSLALRHRRETQDWGDLALDLGIERNRADFSYPALRSRPRATLYHEQFALTGAVDMNSALGVVRMLPPSGTGIAFNPSSNVFLPSALLVGASTSLSWSDAELHAVGGRFARLSGSGQGVETTSGRLESVAYSRRFDGGAEGGIALTAVSGSDTVAPHAALTLSSARPLPEQSGSVRLLGMFDDDGRKGAALDVQFRGGLVAQRAGAWWLDPGLGFSEESAQIDGRGLYWRGDYRFGALTLGGGADFAQSNLAAAPERGGSTDNGGWANVALRLDRSTSIGGAVALRSDVPRMAPAAPVREVLVNTFATHAFSAGTSRWDMSQRSARGEGSAREIERTFGWNHDWPVFAGFSANTLAGLSDQIRPGQRTRRSAFSIGLRGPVSDTVSLNGSVTAAQSRAPDASERNYNAALGVSWSATRNWLLQLDWLRNAILPGADNPQAPFVRENAVLVSVRYEETTGTPYAGPRNGAMRVGTGAIAGSVFFDENGDGVRQATERPARGVVVVLDNRLTQITDSDGRFAFALVTAGTHTLAILSDHIPLPWGSADDAPRMARVSVRDELRVDFPLARLSP